MIINLGSDGQMDGPRDLAFDSEGNLYVCDYKYHHVEMFALIDNRPCDGISTGSSDFFIVTESISSVFFCRNNNINESSNFFI
jgi:hypothetical protein